MVYSADKNYCGGYDSCIILDKKYCSLVICLKCNYIRKYNSLHPGCSTCGSSQYWLLPCYMGSDTETITLVLNLLNKRDDVRVLLELTGEYYFGDDI